MANYNKITVNDEVIIDLTQDTITKEKVPSGLTFHDKSGAVQTGTMPNNGSIAQTMDGINTTSVTIPSGYTLGGTVSLDNTIQSEINSQEALLNLLENTIDVLPNANSGSSGGDTSLEWIPASLGFTTSYIGAPGSTEYYLELPKNKNIIFILFYNPSYNPNNDYFSYGNLTQIGIYNYSLQSAPVGWVAIFGRAGMSNGIVSADDEYFLNISTDKIPEDLYYIIITPSDNV